MSKKGQKPPTVAQLTQSIQLLRDRVDSLELRVNMVENRTDSGSMINIMQTRSLLKSLLESLLERD